MAGMKNQQLFSEKLDQTCLLDNPRNDTQFEETTPIKSAVHHPHVKHDSQKEKEAPKVVGTLELFRFADSVDKVLMFFGTVMAVVNGSNFPLVIFFIGTSVNFMVDVERLQNYVHDIPEYLNSHGYEKDDFMADTKLLDHVMCDDIALFYNGTKNCTILLHHTIMDKIGSFCTMFAIIGGAILIVTYVQIAFWTIVAERQAFKIRNACLKNILFQNIGWFDTHNSAELNTKLSEDISRIQDGIGEKISVIVKSMSGVVLCFTLAFFHGWKLTLVILSCTPVFIIFSALSVKVTTKMVANEVEAYSNAGAIAEEVLGAIRTVVAFGGQDKESQRYFEHLDGARRSEIKKALINGCIIGFNFLLMLVFYALGFWYGGQLYIDDPDSFDVADLIIVVYSIICAAVEAGNMGPALQYLATAKSTAYGIFQLIDTKSIIDSSSESGSKPSTIHGSIQLKNVHFSYPSRPDIKVLNDVTIKVRPGQTVALVGSSGCGKSTVVQLLLRLYDPKSGQVMLDGQNIRDLNIKWLRKSIGIVSQEPVLFSDTIEQNIRYGREDVTFDQIVTATKNANAYDFISQLPDKFNTLVGERGAQLSGGQKQRIAIARALVRDPKILLLDEATSALDTESESVVQDALDKARLGRTTLVIAHRLSTIRTADVIIGLHQGEVKETGSHSDLMAERGIYHQLVVSQMSGLKEEDDIIQRNKADKDNLSTKLKRVTSQTEEEVKEIDENLEKAPFFRLLLMNASEWYYIILGMVGCAMGGSGYPLLSVVFTKFLRIFSDDEDDREDKFLITSMFFLCIGGLLFTAYVFQNYFLACSGEALTLRLRDLTFRSMLKQDISWFDDARNGVGALTTKLSTDASQVQKMTGNQIGAVVMSLSSLGFGLSFAFYYGWLMTLVVIAFLPFAIIGGALQFKVTARQATQNKLAAEDAGKIIVESLDNIRTVVALSLEKTFLNRYMTCLAVPYKSNLRSAHAIGFAYGLSQATMYFCYSASLVFGAYLVKEGVMEFYDVFTVFGCVVVGAIGIGQSAGMFVQMGKAQASAQRILHIIDSKPEIDYTDKNGKILQNEYRPTITFRDVKFHYPTRAGVPVLRGLNLSVAPGQTVALVGSSGCGKSTSIQMIERFYDSVAGSVCLDNNNIKSMNVQWLRQQLGLVSQEPILFNCSIRYNIAYGDNTRDVSMNEIIEAARKANVHNFVSSLPHGYDTLVGSKGTQLSGGQKQRIAIARALVRNPKILLLDEATSALDTESEKIVQEALDKAREGRTCIVIAHRLATIQNADKICVVEDGKVTEQGSHDELINMEGFYYKLVRSSE